LSNEYNKFLTHFLKLQKIYRPQARVFWGW